MRLAIAGLLSLVAATGAWAQEAELSWTGIKTPAGMAAAWAMKPAADLASHPQVIIVMRFTQPGATPGTDVRTSQAYTLEADCPAGRMRPVAQAIYGADFALTESPPMASEWATFAEYGEYGAIVKGACQTKTPALLWKADVRGAQQKLDATIPKPKVPIAPPASSRFEYVGLSTNSSQPIDYWIDANSITREGNIAKAWTVDIWIDGWSRTLSFPPVTWRLREFECGQMLRQRNTFWRQVNDDAVTGYDTERPDATFSTGGDPNIDAIMKRVCNNRPLLFSRTIDGDLKTLVSRRYPGASEKLGSGIPLDKAPQAQRVDLGPTLRISEKDEHWSYTGTFTQSSAGSGAYSGKFEAVGIDNPNPARLYVLGIIDGMLIIERQGTPAGQFAIPVTDGKVSGKGIATWNRDDDTYSWTLVEPTMIKPK